MGNWQLIRGVAATRRGTATGVIVDIVAVLLLVVGCDSQLTPSPEVADSPVVVAAGNIAKCSGEGDEATAELVEGIDGTVVLALGDEAYPEGTAEDFEECYGPSWGRFKGRTKPVPGNHEYYTEGARDYFEYFGQAAGEPEEGYYSYEVGSWHVVALNSNCEEVRCGPGSSQRRWLKEDLAANEEARCTLAYMHHSLFSSGERHGSAGGGVKKLWEALYKADTDVVLSGYEHNYERFAPQDPQGRVNPERGIRQFVVGTGGAVENHPIDVPMENSEVYNYGINGVLELTLHPKSYEWQFVSVKGETFSDSGDARCH